MPMPSSTRPGKSASSAANSSASSAGSYCQMFTIPVAITSLSVASSIGRSFGSRGDPPSQSAPNPSSCAKRAASP